ncbi:MAG TPA: hypothetical protein VKA34_14090 [Balneolales bacterium]|nr:hypothetical protein [Balneolales bacterium]
MDRSHSHRRHCRGPVSQPPDRRTRRHPIPGYFKNHRPVGLSGRHQPGTVSVCGHSGSGRPGKPRLSAPHFRRSRAEPPLTRTTHKELIRYFKLLRLMV